MICSNGHTLFAQVFNNTIAALIFEPSITDSGHDANFVSSMVALHGATMDDTKLAPWPFSVFSGLVGSLR